MATKLNTLLRDFLKETKVDGVIKIEKKIIETFGESFYQKHIEKIYLQKNTITIKTKTSEARSEINLYKTTLTNKQNIKIL